MRAGFIFSLLLVFGLAGAAPAWAGEKSPQPGVQLAPAAQALPGVAPGTADLRRDQELLKRDFKHLEKINQERIQFLEKQIALAGDRVSDAITFLLAFIVFASAVAGFTGYFSARKQAEEAVEKWIDNEGTEVLKGLRADAQKKMEMRTGEAEQLIERRVLEAEERIEELLEGAREKRAELEEIVDRASRSLEEGEEAEISPDDKAEIDRAAQKSEDKETSERTFKDWELQGISAYFNEDYTEAANAFDSAARLKEATPFEMAKALVNKGVALRYAEKLEEAIAVYDEVVKRFGDAEETALLEQVAGALFNKGVALGKAEKPEEAIAVYDEVVRRFGNSKETALLEQVAKALNGKAFRSLIMAKEAWQSTKNEKQAREFLSQALIGANASLEIRPDDPITLGNKGYALFLLEREAEAKPILRKALEEGGEKIRDGELEDAKIHPLPQDEEFKELINRLWEEVSAEKEEDGDGENGGD